MMTAPGFQSPAAFDRCLLPPGDEFSEGTVSKRLDGTGGPTLTVLIGTIVEPFSSKTVQTVPPANGTANVRTAVFIARELKASFHAFAVPISEAEQACLTAYSSSELTSRLPFGYSLAPTAFQRRDRAVACLETRDPTPEVTGPFPPESAPR